MVNYRATTVFGVTSVLWKNGKPHRFIQIKKNQQKFSRLRTKARQTIAEMEGKKPDNDIDIAGSSEDENEMELLGLSKQKPPKKQPEKR